MRAWCPRRWYPTLCGSPSLRQSTYSYNIKELRHKEMQVAEQAEKSYAHFVAAWRPHLPTERRRAAASNRQGLHGLPDDTSSRCAMLRREVDRTMKK